MDEFLPDVVDARHVRQPVLVGVFLVVDMLFELRRESFSRPILEHLDQVGIPLALHALYRIFQLRQHFACSNTDFQGIKLHLMLHFPHLIRLYGRPGNWNTDSWESAHKTMVKFHYKNGSKRVTDINLTTLRAEVSWSELAKSYGVSQIGKLQLCSVHPERGIRNEVRRWRYSNSCESDLSSEFVMYRFNTTGSEICFESSAPHRYQARWVLQPSTRREHSFQPHQNVYQQLLPLLKQFNDQAELSTTIPFFRESFADNEYFDGEKIAIRLHDQIVVGGEGIFQGFRPFHLHANSTFGSAGKLRPRFDTVEITIPSEAGGAIASSRDLVRASQDSAYALVIGIITVACWEQEICLLHVMFYRKIKTKYSKQVMDTVEPCCAGLKYGRPHKQWAALYPLITVKAPALAVPDGDGGNIILPLRFFSRADWDNALNDRTFERHARAELAKAIQREQEDVTQARVDDDNDDERSIASQDHDSSEGEDESIGDESLDGGK